MSAGLPEHRLGNVGAEHEVVAACLVSLAAVVLDELAYQGPLGMPHSQSGAERLGPRDQVEFYGEPAVIPLLGLDKAVEVT